MKYRATINIDFTKQKPQQYQKLVAALMQAGWVYLETSAFIIEGDLPGVLRGMELVAKQCADSPETDVFGVGAVELEDPSSTLVWAFSFPPPTTRSLWLF